MNKIFTFLILGAISLSVKAQTPSVIPETQPFGKVATEDLEMKTCDFEKDANAEVLFDKADVYFDQDLNVTMERHKRIKIFNDNGKDHANIRLEYYGGNRTEFLTGLQAETINLTDGKVEITKLDKKLIYTQTVDKSRTAVVFTMPNVKPGSIIEFKYKWWNIYSYNSIPYWYFQDKIPVRYSELKTEIPDLFYFKIQSNVRIPFINHTTSSAGKSIGTGGTALMYNDEIETRALANIHSLPDEPDMSSFEDNLLSISLHLASMKPTGGYVKDISNTWARVGGRLAEDEDFGRQVKRKLTNEDVIIAKAKALRTDDEKIAYIFNEVKNDMKWNNIDRFYTNDGTYRAWENKSGNSAEINLILCHLLKQAGLQVYPMVVSTRDHGKVNYAYTFLEQFNRAVAYIPVDSTKSYILDASNKYNIYSETPDNLLNSYGLYIDKDKELYDIIFLRKNLPVRQMVLINAEIKADGKMNGTAQISSFSSKRISSITRYKTDGEKKYIDYLRDNDNNLKISSIKFENMEVDTLPLMQNIDFNLDLTGSDDTYIYFNPNLFTSFRSNPFLSENRFTDIDFSHRDSYTINGLYKIPAGYKADVLPKSISMSMPDKSLTFRRIVGQEDGTIVIRYAIDYKKVTYFKEDYPEFHEFFKKMFEMLNEQVVLKKS